MESHKQILVVDDHKDIRDVYQSYLAAEGYRVQTTASGREGLDLLRGGGVDLVILDIRMPEMDGREFLAEARKIDRSLPIVLSTAFAEYKQDFSTWGADAYMVKGTDLSMLGSIVRRLLESGRVGSEEGRGGGSRHRESSQTDQKGVDRPAGPGI